MSLADATLRMVLLGDDVSASAALKRVGANASATEKRLALMSSSMGKLGKTMTHAFTLPALAIAGVSVKMATDFSSAMTRIQTQAGGTAKDVEHLSKQVLALGGHVQQGPVELANSLYHLKSVGMDNADAMRALVQSSHLAAVGNSNLEDTTNALAGAWRTGIKGATDFRQTVGTLNAIVGAGNMTMQDLTAAMGTGILPAAKTFGLSMKDVGAALSVFTDEGQSADSAATRLRMSLSLLGAPSQAAEKVLGGIGLSGHQLGEELRKPDGLVKTIGLLKTNLQGLNNYYPDPQKAQAFVELNKAIAEPLLNKKNLTDAQKLLVQQYTMAKDTREVLVKGKLDAAEQAAVLSRAFGGGKSGATIMSLVNNFDVLQQKQKQVTDGMSKFGAAVAKQAQTPQAQFKLLISTLETLGVQIGDKLLPLFVDWAKKLDSLAGSFQALPPDVQKLAGSFGIALAAMGPALLMTSKLITAYQTLSTTMGDASKKAMAMRMGAAVGGMVALSFAAQTSNDKLKALSTIGGGALMGFAAGGPIGAAIGAGAGGLYILAQHLNDAADAAKKSKADYSGLAGSLDQLTGAVTRDTRQTIENQLARSGALKSLATYGISTRTAISAILGEGQARKVVSAAIKSQSAAIADQRGQIARLTAANVADEKAGTLTPRAQAARKSQIDSLRAQIAAEQNAAGAIRKGIPAFQAQQRALRTNIQATEDLTGKLKGLPKYARTQIEAEGIYPTTKAIAALAQKYHLTPKQITTLIQASGVDTTVKQVKRVQDGLTSVSNTRPNLSAFKASLQAQIDQAGGAARSGGAAIGYALASGVASSIAAETAAVAARSAEMVSNAINAARHAAQAHSPSRKMIALGHDLIDGLMVGIGDRWQPLKDQMSKIQQDVQNAIGRLKSDTQARNQFAGGFQSFATSAFGMPLQQDAAGNDVAPTFGSMFAFAQQQRNQARMVKADVSRLVKMGLSPALLKQIQSQGAAGIPELQALATANKAQIGQFNRLNGQTSSALHGAGMTAGNRIYGSRINQDQRDVHLAKAIAKELAKELHNASKHEVLEIKDTNGEWIVRAIKKRNHRKGVKTAGT